MSKSKDKQQSVRNTPQKKRPSSEKNSRRGKKGFGPIFLYLIPVIALGVAGFFGLRYLSAPPTVVYPENPSSLDPAVAALISPLLEKAEQNPRDAAAHAELGIAYEANGLWREAVRSYENATQLEANNVNWQLHKAIAARQQGDAETALETLRDQADRHPSNAPLMNHLADALLEAGELAEAETAFRNLIDLAPRAVHGYAGLGDIVLQRGAGEEAVQVLEQAVQLDPQYKQARYLLGRAYSLVGRNEEAEAALAAGIGSDIQYLPDPLSKKIAAYTVNASGRISQASAFLDAGNPVEAARLLEASYRYHNTNVMLLNTLASAYLKTGRLDDAYRLLTRARDLDTDQFFTYLNLYTWALRSGKKEEALAFAEEAVARAPERDDTHLARAQALAELGRLDEALAGALEALNIDGTKAGNHGLVGEIYFRKKNYEDAAVHLEQALSIDAGLLPAIVSLAETRWELAQFEEARQLLQRARQIAPNHPRVWQLALQLNAR